MDYQRRIIDQSLDELMPGLSAIALDGAKGVGKTATGLQRANTVFDLSVPSQQQVVAADIGLVSRANEPVFIDEWQLLPEVWGEVKRAVDR
ncbi:MAG: hypothetical protein FWG25_09040 [Promicromonosporaceae bacterium]|nr:hypothetical protein [Promicromonosporaceae bacterium]